MAFWSQSLLERLQLENLPPIHAPGNEYLFQITGTSRSKFCAGGMMVNGCAIHTADYLKKWCLGRSWATIKDHCQDLGLDFKMYDNKDGKAEQIEWRNVGFTGTQEGMTRQQKRTLHSLLNKLRENQPTIWFRHGDCVGADAEAHNIALDLKYQVLIHPPEDEKKRAFCEEAFSVLPARPYLERNLRIVENSHILLAAPKGLAEEKRSGTWSTIRAANNLGVPVRIIFPDGSFRKGIRK